ncbi:MAG: hypothetical protein ACMG57_04915 [Candidatus Dojkabacteria bacterium]
MKIIKLDFKKTTDIIDSSSYGNVDLNDGDNLKNIEKYIIPVISENEGWGTHDVTLEGFKKNPFQYQDALDATLFANVHVGLDELGNPLGLIEFLEETLDNPVSKVRMENIKNMITKRSSWVRLIKMKVVSEEVMNSFFPFLEKFIAGKKIYSEIGIVVRADLQGKKSGVTEALYKLLSDGIQFAWTNNPLIIAIKRKHFSNVHYFPLLGESIVDLEGLAALAILYGDLQTYDESRWVNLDFGAMKSPYFVNSRGNVYLEIAAELAIKGKITKMDEARVKYCLDKDAVQGAIFAF